MTKTFGFVATFLLTLFLQPLSGTDQASGQYYPDFVQPMDYQPATDYQSQGYPVIDTPVLEYPLLEAQPAVYPFVIARPQDRAWLDSMPIEHRPYRPFHVYGNMVRRSYNGSYSAPRPGMRSPVQGIRRFR